MRALNSAPRASPPLVFRYPAKRPNGSAIAGLYAAGGSTGGLEGGGALGYVGGLIKACVFGLRVAEHAAGKHHREAGL